MTEVIAGPFVCPLCRSEISALGREVRCSVCDWSAVTTDGVLDLVPPWAAHGERDHYDQYYSKTRGRTPPEDVHDLTTLWTSADAPWEMQRVWNHLNDLRGKTVLLLGNGESFRELALLSLRPARLIFSDLSPVGLRDLYPVARQHDELSLAAIDAMALPIRDSSVDVVYGFAFVHHLPDLDQFMREVHRVLRTGGRSVFMDDAYSPLWQALKLRALRPLIALSHRRDPRSPEDVRVTLEGGFREDQLVDRILAVGGAPFTDRVALFYYMWRRLTVSIFPPLGRVPASGRLLALLKRLDERLLTSAWGRRNMVRLVWGFEKT